MTLDDLDYVEFDAVGGSQADAFSAAIAGPSPYNGSLPFAVELHVHQDVVDDDFVVTVQRPRGGPIVTCKSPLGFARDDAVIRAICEVLRMPRPATLAATTGKLADYGYRFIAKPTGAPRGHTEQLLLMADPISELDAALQLGAEPDYIYDLLDDGADPMRLHVKFGRPVQVALLKSLGIMPHYSEVVAYMRACGAHVRMRTY